MLRFDPRIIIYVFIILLAGALPVFAEPSINNASGTVADGSSVTISGLCFGENSAVGTNDLQWLGENIEQGSLGSTFVKAGWSSHQIDDGFNEPKYSSEQFHSGSKSIQFDIPPGKWGCYYYYNHGSPITSVYVTWWTIIHPNPDYKYGQWKMWRLSPTSSATDQNSNIMFGNWFADDSSDGMKIPVLVIDNSYSPMWPPPAVNGRLWLDKFDFPMFDEWVRMEIYAVQSDFNQSNGTFIYSIIRDNGIPIRTPVNYAGNLQTCTTGSSLWQYYISPHYCGDGLKGTYWSDDVYLQFGSQSRVEIGDGSTWNACTHREIQIPTAWTDNSITTTFNQGSFNNGDTVYLYVVDENGNVNANGFPVTIGQGTNSFDLNSDGKVDITDVQACVNHFLGAQDYGTKADVNSDGAVNVIDVQAIVNTVLAG